MNEKKWPIWPFIVGWVIPFFSFLFCEGDYGLATALSIIAAGPAIIYGLVGLESGAW